MTTKAPLTAVGVLDNRQHAEAALVDLRSEGFADSQIGLGILRTEVDATEAQGPPTWTSGAALGGLSGAALGGLAAGPAGMLGGG